MGIAKVNSKEEFSNLIKDIEKEEWYKRPLAFGIGRVDRGQKNANLILQITFPFINWNENFGSAAIFLKALKESKIDVDTSKSEFVATLNDDFVNNALNAFAPFLSEATAEAHKNVQVVKYLSQLDDIGKDFKIVFLFEDDAPKSVESVYLKLYALSLRKVPIRGINLNGAFGILPNVAWVGRKPYELDYLREKEIELKLSGSFPNIDSVDKFPRYLQHIIPDDNIRILDSSKVRMGAQLAKGTTLMPGASYINFNAGTLGPSMVEGRISSSAVVGSGSDVGGGASILGVLSGTDGNPITIGENCLLGANSVTGIPLGDGCIIDAGVAILAGTKVKISAKDLEKIQEANPNIEIPKKEIFKAAELQGLNGIHFRQDSLSGEIIAKRSTREVKLNEELH